MTEADCKLIQLQRSPMIMITQLQCHAHARVRPSRMARELFLAHGFATVVAAHAHARQHSCQDDRTSRMCIDPMLSNPYLDRMDQMIPRSFL